MSLALTVVIGAGVAYLLHRWASTTPVESASTADHVTGEDERLHTTPVENASTVDHVTGEDERLPPTQAPAAEPSSDDTGPQEDVRELIAQTDQQVTVLPSQDRDATAQVQASTTMAMRETDRVAPSAPSAAPAAPASADEEPAAAAAPPSVPAARPSRSCHRCGCDNAQKRLSRCSRCKAVYFCSRECQAAAWPTHRANVSRRRRLLPASPAKSIEAIAEEAAREEAKLAKLQHEKQEAALAHLNMGTPSAYREAAKLAAESAALAARRANIARDTASAVEGGVGHWVLSGMLKHLAEEECNARSLCVKARLRSGDAAAALSEADLAVAAAERTEDLPHLVDSVVMRGTALLHVRGPQAAMDEHERALRLCKDSPWRGAPSASACDTDGVAARRHDARRMLGAEASARSNLARDLHGMDRVDEALALQERAVTLRREADGDAAADGEASAGERGELRRALGQTLCNYGIMLGGAADAATPDRLQQGRACWRSAAAGARDG